MTMGATSSVIRNVFLFFGSIVGIVGIIIGSIVGLVIALNFGELISFIEMTFNVKFLKVYFIDYFPVDIRPEWVGSISFITFIFCALFTIYPSKIASNIDPVEVLKYE